MDRLEQGGAFEYRELLSGRREHISADGTIDIPRSQQSRQVAERVEVGQHAYQLHFGGFQMTVGTMPGNIMDGMADDLTKLGPNGNRLYFLFPPLHCKIFINRTL
ncbi:uncharacterized protein PHALS_01842 [Plasmopara halstedii]|uniref:Uncharacterized protein n=1 Tax=Plasmopara halstedii TaxID=4781 RepID=A0A0P1ATV5_PLAHL|nr:uncharacterized protein PHALS_01842 [Plasmopara halstedii]CEG45553.1 hypothetical protein PHALS_01842 [Plasmopara halstedii]|eukprot:XP_024581922.1 hypothetical protein PHALS_01842 [Plasmopara halstedii]